MVTGMMNVGSRSGKSSALKTVSYWVHASYSRDLQKLGYAPEERGLGPFDRYTLSEEDWGAFCALYDPPPHLYKEPV